MKIINTKTNEVLAEVMANHSMTIEEACELADIKLMVTQEDWENEDGYDVNDLEMVY